MGFLLMVLTYVLLTAAGFLLAGDGNRVSALWMVMAFVVLTVSEVLVSVIGLELAFTAAPANMKGFVTACWLVTVFLGNMVTVPIAPLYEKLGPGSFFAGMAVLMAITSCAFFAVGRRFQRTKRDNPKDLGCRDARGSQSPF